MLALFALIGAQIVPVMRTPAPVVAVQPPGAIRETISVLPDLVVKDVRIEGDSRLHLLVANEGTADSPPQVAMYVKATGYGSVVGPRGGIAQWLIPQLKAATERWITVPSLKSGRTDEMPLQSDVSLADLSSFTAYVDPYVIVATSMWSATNAAQFDPALCKTAEAQRLKRGCVPETNEENNVISIDKSAIQPWDTHLGVRRH